MTREEALNSMEILRGYFSDWAKGLENKTIKQTKQRYLQTAPKKQMLIIL